MYLDLGTNDFYMQGGSAVNGASITQTPGAGILRVMVEASYELMPLQRLCTHSEHLEHGMELFELVSHPAPTHRNFPESFSLASTPSPWLCNPPLFLPL